MTLNFIKQLTLVFLVPALSGLHATAQEREPEQPNILVLIADDVGVEQIAPFGIGTNPAETPTLNELAERGMRFSQVWAQGMCSPTRATLLSGRYGFRTGVGSTVTNRLQKPEVPPPGEDVPFEVHENVGANVIPYLSQYTMPRGPNATGGPGAGMTGMRAAPPGTSAGRAVQGLQLDELALPALLKQAPTPYATAAIGKWHLASESNGWLEHPQHVGFDFYSLLMENEPESYFSWSENINGVHEVRSGYTPEIKVDTAIDWIAQQGEQPWFLWVAFNLPHFPQHVPQVEHLDTSAISADQPQAALDAMIARLDQEIGRLFDGIDSEILQNTLIVFVGDNGTTGRSIDPPFHQDRAKFTLYEGGLRVPLIVAGPGIPEGRQSSALINTTDLFTTILDLADAPVPDDRPVDGISMLPYFKDPTTTSARDWLYADMFGVGQDVRTGGYAVRDDRYKLLRIRERIELYNVASDIGEVTNLLADGISESEQTIVDRLQGIADRLHESEE